MIRYFGQAASFPVGITRICFLYLPADVLTEIKPGSGQQGQDGFTFKAREEHTMEQDLSRNQDRFLGYVVRDMRTGEFRSRGSRPAPVAVPAYVATPAWAHRYEDIEEARAAAQRSRGEVVILCDRKGRYAVTALGH